MPIDDQDETVLGQLAASIRAAPGSELVRATPNHVVFCGTRPRRTFDIRFDGANGFHVTEIMAGQPAGRHRAAACRPERTRVNQVQMTEWTKARLDEVRMSSLFSAGFKRPEGSTIVMLIVSAMVTFCTWAV